MKRILVTTVMATALLTAGVCSAAPPMPPDPWDFIVGGPCEEKDMMEGTVPSERSGEGKEPRPADTGQPRGMHPRPGAHGPSGMMEPCPPALLARILDLSDDQKKQISAVLKNAREDAVPLLKKREENFRQLRKVEGTPVFDEKTVSAVARSIGGIEAEMIVSRAKTHARIRELLTPAQRELVSRIEPWIFGPPLPPPCGKPR